MRAVTFRSTGTVSSRYQVLIWEFLVEMFLVDYIIEC